MTSLPLQEKALMGMEVKSVRADGGMIEILATGARVRLEKGGLLSVSQTIGARREVVRSALPPHLCPWRLVRQTPFACELMGYGMKLTVQGDAVLIFEPQQHLVLSFEIPFAPRYHQEERGNRLLLDDVGGCGFFPLPARPSEWSGGQASGTIRLHLARYDELWVSVCPPREHHSQRYGESVAHESLFAYQCGNDPERAALNRQMAEAVIRDAARHCAVFAEHAGWACDAPDWAQDPPGCRYAHPKPWEADRYVPCDPDAFRYYRTLVQELGMKFVPYVSPYFSAAPDPISEFARVLDEYGVDGLYFDGWAGERDDFRPAYRMLRAARELLGERILYLHSSTEPFGTARVYPPFGYAYADYVLSGEAGRFDLSLDDFLRFSVGQYQISNAVGLWCYYGSMGKPGYRMDVPTSEHIEAALRNRARIWRQGKGWSAHPDALARFDREYFGKLAQDALQ